MNKQIFIVHGDITQLAADALVYPTDFYGQPGHLHAAFERAWPAFPQALKEALRPAGVSERKRLFLGETAWVTLPHAADCSARQPQGVTVVSVVGGNVRPARKNRKAVEAAIRATVKQLGPGNGRRHLIAIPGLRMGAALGKRPNTDEAWNERKEAARAQMEAAQECLRDYPDVDVAFVAYTPDLYHLYLKSREAVCGQEGSVAVPSPLAQAIRDGECVLFIGSGLSTGAGLDSWGGLIDGLADKMDLPRDTPKSLDYFLDVAQVYRQRFGPDRLAQDIGEHFGGEAGTPTLAHYLLMSLGVRHVVTTNYDSLLERTLTALRHDPVPVIQEGDVAKTGQREAQFVIKFHGDAGHPKTLILSRDDYNDFFHQRPAMASLLEGLLLNQTFFFVGYSLSDPDFHQIYSRIARMLKASQRHAFATTLEESTLTRQIWESKNLHVLPMTGASPGEKSQALIRFLDSLAAQVALSESKAFLAPDLPEEAGPLADLRRTLKHLGSQVEEASWRPLTPEEAHELASTLRYLTRHGWRPSIHETAEGTWRRLAKAVGDADQKRAMLREALKHTERWADAKAIRDEIAKN